MLGSKGFTMAQYVNNLPESDKEPTDASQHTHPDPADQGLAGELKHAGLVTSSKPGQEVKGYRPIGIALAATLMLMGAAWMMPFVFILSTNMTTPPVALGAAVAILTLFGIMASMAMFMMKRWSVFLYTGVAIAANLIFLLIGQWNPVHLIVPLFILAAAYTQLKYLR